MLLPSGVCYAVYCQLVGSWYACLIIYSICVTQMGDLFIFLSPRYSRMLWFGLYKSGSVDCVWKT